MAVKKRHFLRKLKVLFDTFDILTVLRFSVDEVSGGFVAGAIGDAPFQGAVRTDGDFHLAGGELAEK
jgi:hypothetical protein